jgi:uncharacterized protein YhhL (DUF1145 family)
MTKYVLSIGALGLFATGFVWSSLILSLVIAFRYAAYILPFVVLTLCIWIYDVQSYIYVPYIVLALILVGLVSQN